MGSIFKKFGQGILYLFVLPLLLVAVAIFGVYGIFLFIVLMIKSIILFFKGKSLNSDLPEDIEARKILHPEKIEPKPIVEEREPIVIVERRPDPEDEAYRRIEVDPPKSAITMEEDSLRIEHNETPAIEESPAPLLGQDDYEEDEYLEEEEYEEEEETDEVEKLTVDDLIEDDDDYEEEEEDIPTLQEDSKITNDDSVDTSDSDPIYRDWRK